MGYNIKLVGDDDEIVSVLRHQEGSDFVMDGTVEKLGTLRDADYWRPTPGNAGDVLYVLLKWARHYPYAIFMGD